MAFQGKASSGGGDFKNATPGTVAGVCTRIIDLGTQEGGQYGPKRKVMLAFEIDEKMDDGRPFMVQSRFTLSFNKKAILLQTLESWRGKAYGDNDDVDLVAVAGKPALLNLVESPDGKYVNIKSVSPMPKGMPAPTPAGEVIVFNLDVPDWDAYNALSEYLQETIAKSPEYRDAMGEKAAPATASAPAQTATAGAPFNDPIPTMDDIDADVPF